MYGKFTTPEKFNGRLEYITNFTSPLRPFCIAELNLDIKVENLGVPMKQIFEITGFIEFLKKILFS